jgi:hypothetical protein
MGAIDRAQKVSQDGKVVIESDMRAHMNPTRMQTITKLGKQMGERLLTLCPECDTPGWGRTQSIAGLPCELCGLPTKLTKYEMHRCSACDYVEQHPREDGEQTAYPTYCDHCYP